MLLRKLQKLNISLIFYSHKVKDAARKFVQSKTHAAIRAYVNMRTGRVIVFVNIAFAKLSHLNI